MPTGIIINSLSIILGGIAGGLFGDYLRDDFKENLNLIFGLASMVMGISAIINMVNMPAVIFAVVIGTIIPNSRYDSSHGSGYAYFLGLGQLGSPFD